MPDRDPSSLSVPLSRVSDTMLTEADEQDFLLEAAESLEVWEEFCITEPGSLAPLLSFSAANEIRKQIISGDVKQLDVVLRSDLVHGFLRVLTTVGRSGTSSYGNAGKRNRLGDVRTIFMERPEVSLTSPCHPVAMRVTMSSLANLVSRLYPTPRLSVTLSPLPTPHP